MKVALTIAGSDSGGGAGVQADLAAFVRAGVWGTTALTCVTAQDPAEVTRIDPVAPDMVAAQISAVCGHFPVAAIKIGMTFSAEIIVAIARSLDAHARGVTVVLDPIMRATSGTDLLDPVGRAIRRVPGPTHGLLARRRAKGFRSDGTWTIYVNDGAGADTGTLSSWTLHIAYRP